MVQTDRSSPDSSVAAWMNDALMEAGDTRLRWSMRSVSTVAMILSETGRDGTMT